jgi:hypothetical protein
MKNTKKFFLFGLMVLIPLTISTIGCEKITTNLIVAKDLCISEYKDLYKLDYWLYENPIPHDEFSQEYEPYSERLISDYQSRYRRVFYTRSPVEIYNTSLELAPGFTIESDVRIFKTTEKAQKGFIDFDPPRFKINVVDIIGIPGIKWDIDSIGSESKAWYYMQEVLDDNREKLVQQVEAVVIFRIESVLSEIRVTTWGGDLKETELFLLNLAQVNEYKITEAIIQG